MDKAPTIAISILATLTILCFGALVWFGRAPDSTVSQYVDTERGVVCYTYGSSGISCVKD